MQETAAQTDVGVDAGVDAGVGAGVGAESERRGLSDSYGLSDRSAAFTTLLSNMARVIGPTPPGFGER